MTKDGNIPLGLKVALKEAFQCKIYLISLMPCYGCHMLQPTNNSHTKGAEHIAMKLLWCLESQCFRVTYKIFDGPPPSTSVPPPPPRFRAAPVPDGTLPSPPTPFQPGRPRFRRNTPAPFGSPSFPSAARGNFMVVGNCACVVLWR